MTALRRWLYLFPFLVTLVVAGAFFRPASGRGETASPAPAPGRTRVPFAAAAPPAITPTPTPIPWDDILVSDHEDTFINQGLVVAGQNVYVAYSANEGSPDDTYLARSSDGGRTFLPSVLVYTATYIPALAWWPGVEPSQERGVLYLALQPLVWDYRPHFTRSTDGGETWSLPRPISPLSGIYPKIAVDAQGGIYVVTFKQNDYDVRGYFYLSRSSDGGDTWSDPIPINSEPWAIQYWCSFFLVARGTTLYFVWAGWVYIPGNKPADSQLLLQTVFSRSTDRGQTWSAPVQVDDAPNKAYGVVAMAVGGSGVIYVAWSADKIPGYWGEPETYVSRSTDGGATWGPGVRVDDDDTCERFISPGGIAVDDRTGSVHLVFWDGRRGCAQGCSPGDDVFYTYSTDGGATWSRNQQISNPWPSNEILGTSMQVQEGKVYTVWSGLSGQGWLEDIWLDIHRFYLPPVTPTPTPSITPAPTITPTPATTPSPTPTVTASPPPTPSPTPPGEWYIYLPWVERSGE
jgi:hypothetical protein